MARYTIDAVCGQNCGETHFSVVYLGDTYYFCDSKCMAAFQANPAEYADPEERL